MDNHNTPFFIVGCVRSGTTLLRDLLRMHPRLACPEETHFFRWGEAFAGARFERIQRENPVLQKHREMDGISQQMFSDMLEQSADRRDLQDRYGEAFLARPETAKPRWFDKTPQNCYGLLLLSAYYPEAKILHIHRHPLNVVNSLLEGKVMPVHALDGAINTWKESALIMQRFESAWPDQVMNVSYESLTEDPVREINKILGFVGEQNSDIDISSYNIYPEQNRYREGLTPAQISIVKARLAGQMAGYGYE